LLDARRHLIADEGNAIGTAWLVNHERPARTRPRLLSEITLRDRCHGGSKD